MPPELRRAVPAVVFALLVPLGGAWAQGLLDDFFLAVENDRDREVRALVARGIGADSVDAAGDPAIVVAARSGSVRAAEVLLAAGAKPDARNRHGDTAMMLAALNGHLAIAKARRAQGASVRGPGWTPLT